MERGSPCVWEGSHLAGGGVAWGVKGAPAGVEMSYIWSVVQINVKDNWEPDTPLSQRGRELPSRKGQNYKGSCSDWLGIRGLCVESRFSV